MKSHILLAIVALLMLPVGCKLSERNLFSKSAQAKSASSQSDPTPRRKAIDPEYEEYAAQVRENFSKSNFEWIENEASKLRTSRERLPGGYWKLRVLFRTIEDTVDDNAS